MGAYEQTGLWRRALDEGADAPQARERLRAAYRAFWKNAVALSREIQRDVPNLTLHDETHFEALWARADQIAGALVLTPLEAFVLGGAILLHDNANSIAAFEGGLAALRATPTWQDAATDWKMRAQGDSDTLVDDDSQIAQAAILFEVLRGLHAERASSLAGFKVSIDGRTFHLIEDDQFRAHLGDIIGLIAASHHWNIDSLSQRLPEIQGALAGMPASWTLRPVLLACLLRTADATQLDQARAPDFLYALLQLQGVSEQHWRAQNRLATPVVSPHDPSALIFNSTRPFLTSDAEAWWIAHDAVRVADAELQAANALLRDLRLPPLAITRIEGARSPQALARHIAVRGWRPVQAEVTISQVGRVVEMFGGQQLYGQDKSVALRELIQNAADAVRFRRELEPASAGFEGRITVRLTPAQDIEGDWWLEVEDDGLGMSEAVLTGPLIDFGASYMSSALVRSERPGLLSKGRSRIGKFGIGFFSAFMVADEVLVASRPFDAGREALRTLHFVSGLGHRPLLIDQSSEGYSPLVSTRVRLRLTAEMARKLLSLSRGGSSRPVTLPQMVGVLCPLLDVDVFVDDGQSTGLVHPRRWMDEDRLTWLRRIIAADAFPDHQREQTLQDSVAYIRFIDPDAPHLGLAAAVGAGTAGVVAVGTLASNYGLTRFSQQFIGAIDHEPGGPRRDAGRARAGTERMAAWATNQAKIIAEAGISAPECVYAAQRVADFGGDATPIAMIQLNREWADLETVLAHLIAHGPIYAPIQTGLGAPSISQVRQHQTGFIDNYFPGELELCVPTLEASDTTSSLFKVPTDDEPYETSFIALLANLAERRGYGLQLDVGKFQFATYVGEDAPREGLRRGQPIGCQGLKFSLLAPQRPGVS